MAEAGHTRGSEESRMPAWFLTIPETVKIADRSDWGKGGGADK